MSKAKDRMQKVTMQMLTPKQWRATMLAARLSWGVGENDHQFFQKHFGSNLQANYDFWLQGWGSKKDLIDHLRLLELY